MGQPAKIIDANAINRQNRRRKDYINEWRQFVTPTQAKEWLGLNTNNYRSLSDANVQNLRRAMELGLFHVGACGPIAFHEDGTLADGQHRLTAIVVSNIGAHLTIREGLKDEDILALDSGKRRTAVDRIKQLGLFTKPRIVAPASRFMLLGLTAGFATAMHGRSGVSDVAQVNLCINEADAFEFATSSMTGQRARFDGNSSLHILRVIAALDYSEKVQEFTDLFVTGAGLSERNPILALREQLIRLRHDAEKAGGKNDFREVSHELTFLAWNKWLEGKRATKLRAPGKTLVVPKGWESWVPKAVEYRTESDQ